ncbi:unnamed protein product [Rhizophagus irregularis]|nr:unnamed protein product [Rhizophagus irregularis]
MFPHIDNLLDLLVKSQTNSLLALFNTDTLRPIAIQKLDMLTQELWYPENDFTLSNYRTLTYPLTDNYSIPARLQNIPEQTIGSHKKLNEWTYHWNASIQNCIIGKTYLQDTDTCSSISIMEHYIPINNSLLAIDLSFQSSCSSPLILVPCSGCHLNDHSLILQDARIRCTISVRTNRLSVFNTFHRSNQEHKKYANLSLKKYFVSTKPLHFIRYSAHSIYLAQHNINTTLSPSTLMPTNSHSSNSDDIIKHLTTTIQSAVTRDIKMIT